ncbi:MAG: dual specificity protein phosphatase [Acidobacteriota bacterium]|nr:dual specificity protein phosphatase [Acidobacteriota bacterium]
MSLTQVWERLFVGGIGDAEALAESNPHKISTVVTLCRETTKKRAPRLNYLYFPLRDDRPVPVGRLDAIIDAIAENIRWGTVLVHSLEGVNRAPVIAAAWMHVVGCENIDAALVEVGKLRTIEPNPILLRSVKESL